MCVCGGGGGGVGWEWGGRGEELYLTLHCPQQNFCIIKMGSDKRHLNVLYIVEQQVEIRHPPSPPLITYSFMSSDVGLTC